MASESSSVDGNELPEEFSKVLRDFKADLKTTFPEYSALIDKPDETTVFAHCKTKLPPRFFDILYQNDEMYKSDSTIDTEFLPAIHFKNLWQCELTEKTRDTMWKYLQLLLFSVVSAIEDKSMFGDTAQMFDAINETEFRTKLQETLSQMKGLFGDTASGEASADGDDTTPLDTSAMPNAEEINDHLTGLFGGKIGQLAREIAEEAMTDLDIDMNQTMDNSQDVFQKLMKNPLKLMSLVKKIGSKIDTKMKSGEIKESEMLEEAAELMKKMKDMPGMGNLQSMFSKMGMGPAAAAAAAAGMGNGKMNMGAMESQLNRQLRQSKLRDRLRARVNNKADAATATAIATGPSPPPVSFATDEEWIRYISGDKPERTPRKKTGESGEVPKTTSALPPNHDKKKKKGKK